MATSTTKKTTTPAKSTSKTAASKKATTSKTTTTKKTTTTTTKKTTTSSADSFRVSAAEKKLIQNFRKCSDIEKQLLTLAVEKCASNGGSGKKGGFDLSSITKLLGN